MGHTVIWSLLITVVLPVCSFLAHCGPPTCSTLPSFLPYRVLFFPQGCLPAHHHPLPHLLAHHPASPLIVSLPSHLLLPPHTHYWPVCLPPLIVVCLPCPTTACQSSSSLLLPCTPVLFLVIVIGSDGKKVKVY